jgi:hypothetical protein
MKIKVFTFIFILLSITLQAQTSEQYSFKIQGLYGNILKHTTHLIDLVQGPVIGGEIDVEWQTMGEKTWQQYLNFPVFGVGSVWLNLGNPEKLGNAFAIYPYINIPLWRTNYFNLYVKGGMGASFLTKTYYNTNKQSDGTYYPDLTGTNAAIGSVLNIYFAGGGGIEIPVSKGFKIIAEYTWNHTSNGSAVAPNSGINMLNGFVGLKYFPHYKTFEAPSKKDIGDLQRKFTVELIASGGFRQLYYKDNYLNGKPSGNPNFVTFPIASVVLAVYRPITNFYRMGLGMDVFYDGAYNGKTYFERTYLKTDELKNKIRMGISWQHELLIGRITAGFHFGLYLYNPLKNLEPYAMAGIQNKGLIYPYDIEQEDGWLYTRAALKYSLTKHYFISLGLKTHLQKAEFIEWGLGYKF